MSNNSVGDHNAGAVAYGGHNNAAPANFTVGAVGFGPLADEDDDTVQLTHAGWKRVTNSMAESIVRIQRELEEAQAQIAVYEAERTILIRERNEALHDATQQTIKVSVIKSRWIAARQALESIAEGTQCRECDGEDQARLAREGLEASK